MTSVSMPAARARSRPPASARFEITTAILASSRPSAIASISACRLLPRPEISTPSTRALLLIDDAFASGSNLSDPDRAVLTGGCQPFQQSRLVAGRAYHDQANPHVERAQHVGIGDATRSLKPFEDGQRLPR